MNDSKKKTAARRTHRFMTRDDLLVWLSRAWLVSLCRNCRWLNRSW